MCYYGRIVLLWPHCVIMAALCYYGRIVLLWAHYGYCTVLGYVIRILSGYTMCGIMCVIMGVIGAATLWVSLYYGCCRHCPGRRHGGGQ